MNTLFLNSLLLTAANKVACNPIEDINYCSHELALKLVVESPEVRALLGKVFNMEDADDDLRARIFIEEFDCKYLDKVRGRINIKLH